jgi:hypothetical protein
MAEECSFSEPWPLVPAKKPELAGVGTMVPWYYGAMYKEVQAFECECEVCGHGWLARALPGRCAKCKSRKWNGTNGASGPMVPREDVTKVTPARVEVDHPPFVAGAKCDCCRGPVYESSNPTTGVRKWKCQSGHYSSPKQPEARNPG